MSDRPTPETDAAEYLISIGRKNDQWVVRSDVSRKLELERDDAREEIRDWKRLHDAAERGVDLTIAEGTISDLLKQRDEALEQVKELIYIAGRAIDLAEIDFENDKFGVVSELRDGLEKIKEDTK